MPNVSAIADEKEFQEQLLRGKVMDEMESWATEKLEKAHKKAIAYYRANRQTYPNGKKASDKVQRAAVALYQDATMTVETLEGKSRDRVRASLHAKPWPRRKRGVAGTKMPLGAARMVSRDGEMFRAEQRHEFIAKELRTRTRTRR